MVKSCSSFIFAPIANISAKDVYKRQALAVLNFDFEAEESDLERNMRQVLEIYANMDISCLLYTSRCV